MSSRSTTEGSSVIPSSVPCPSHVAVTTPPAGGPLDALVGQRALRRDHVGLHLLDLRQHAAQIVLPRHGDLRRSGASVDDRPARGDRRGGHDDGPSSTTVASKSWIIRATESTGAACWGGASTSSAGS